MAAGGTGEGGGLALRGGEVSAAERAAYGDGVERVAPGSEAELADLVRAAEAEGRPLIPSGAGSQPWLGAPPPPGACIVSLERFADIVRYEPGDFTVGVQAGVPVETLRRRLAENGQELPVDAPRGAAGTLGGEVSVALPGPRRAGRGPLRSAVIGTRALRGGGRVFRAGGMVVKNVAGYEVSRFLTGALGTAGILLEANFKLRPLPRARRGGRAAFARPEDAWRFADAVRRRRLEPAALWVLDEGAARRLRSESTGPAPAAEVVWVLEGNEALVAWLEAELDALEELRAAGDVERRDREGADALLDGLGALDRPGDPAGGCEAIVRIAAWPGRARPAAVAAGEAASSGPAGDGDAEAGAVAADAQTGHLVVRLRRASEDALRAALEELRRVAAETGDGGWHIVLPPGLRYGRPWVFGREHAAAEQALARRLLAVLDPAGVFCPGRVSGAAEGG